MKVFVWKYIEADNKDVFLSVDKDNLDSFIDEIRELKNGMDKKIKLLKLPDKSPHYIDDEDSLLSNEKAFSFTNLKLQIIDQSQELIIDQSNDLCMFIFNNQGFDKFIDNIKASNTSGSFVRFNTIPYVSDSIETEVKGKLRSLGTLNGKPIFM